MAQEICLVFMPYCPGSIGEQIVQLPLFHFLAERYGRENVIGVAPEESSFLIEAMGAAGAVEAFSNQGGLTTVLAASRRLKTRRAAAAYQIRRKSARTSFLARLSGAHRIHGYAGTAASRLHHASTTYSKQEYVGENYVRLAGRSLADFAAAFPREDGGYALLVPGGRRPEKRYPLDRYLQVAEGVKRHRPVQFLLGPDTKADEVMIRHAGHEALHPSGLPEMIDVVRRASLVVANDCGPGHAAHIHDVPRVSLFGLPHEIPHWFHGGQRGRVMEPPPGKPIGAIEPRDVIAMAEQALRARDAVSGG